MLDTILDAAGVPPIKLVVVHHSLAAPATPLVRELLARGEERGQPSLTIAIARPATGNVLDLTGAVAGYSEIDVEGKIKDACDKLPPTAQVYIDAADILAEDYGRAVAFRVLRSILNRIQPPGRLILSLPTSEFYEDVLSATLSPSLTLLTPHNARAVESTSRALLIRADEDRFWHQLSPSQGDALALRGAEGVDINPCDEYVVQILTRKATGGAKGMLRSLEGIRRRKGPQERWDPVALETVVTASPLTEVKVTTHADLALPFNLSLTDRQRAERGAVPLPYAHEGEGADLGMGMDWSDDEEDEEI